MDTGQADMGQADTGDRWTQWTDGHRGQMDTGDRRTQGDRWTQGTAWPHLWAALCWGQTDRPWGQMDAQGQPNPPPLPVSDSRGRGQTDRPWGQTDLGDITPQAPLGTALR